MSPLPPINPMNDPRLIDDAVEALEESIAEEAPTQENPAGFWLRLLQSLRVKISGSPPNKIELTGRAEF